jgi:hypothetical protein
MPQKNALDSVAIQQLRDCGDIRRNLHRKPIAMEDLAVEFSVAIRDQVLDRLRGLPIYGTEDSALALLALRHSGADPVSLLRQQHASGAWNPFPGVEVPNAYHTALALLALRPYKTPAVRQAADRAFEFLSELRGRESHWLWQWKFRLFDRQVRFDPSKSGWPWVPGTVSWVAPTALVILAFRSWRLQSPRVAAGAEMLLDRACPRGGWNAGNSVVFGVELDPHPDFTAMAALALLHSGHGKEAIVRRSLDYLVDRLDAAKSPYSLAWATIALSAYGHEGADRLRSRLESNLVSRVATVPAPTFGVAALALERPVFAFEESMP